MVPGTFFKFVSISCGIALLLAGLFFDGGLTASSVTQLSTPAGTPSALERLAKPTLPAEPSQADLGAVDYWLYCLPCHGDRGQGLTEEFRETYPPDEVDCWQSGCHGKRPYENGFTIPQTIPAVIGGDSLQKFSNAAVLQVYIYATMPYWDPGSLKPEETWRITAFLLRENGLWDALAELDASSAERVQIRAAEAEPTPVPDPDENPSGDFLPGFLLILGLATLLLILWRVWRSGRRPAVS